MGAISVAQAADRLGVSQRRVRERIAAGSLHAERLGSQWAVDESSLLEAAESNKRGRPLSDRSAWAILAASAPEAPGFAEHLSEESPVLRHHARRRIDRLIRQVTSPQPNNDDANAVPRVAALLRAHLQNRAERHVFRASQSDLADLRADERLVLSGLSHRDSNMAAGDIVEAYVQRAVLSAIVDEYLLDEARDGNVVLHVLAGNAPALAKAVSLMVAADLAEHRGSREEARAVEILQEVARTLKAHAGNGSSAASGHGG